MNNIKVCSIYYFVRYLGNNLRKYINDVSANKAYQSEIQSIDQLL